MKYIFVESKINFKFCMKLKLVKIKLNAIELEGWYLKKNRKYG